MYLFYILNNGLYIYNNYLFKMDKYIPFSPFGPEIPLLPYIYKWNKVLLFKIILYDT